MKNYLDLLADVKTNGEIKEDRTGTGTLSVFGRQTRFDLREGFPCLTTKKLHLRSIIEELLWFLQGDTNIKGLNDKKVTLWDEWASPEGDLGPVYSSCWRSWPGNDGKIVEIDIPKSPKRPQFLSETVIDSLLADTGPKGKIADLWKKMMSRCYNTSDPEFEKYIRERAYVASEWHNYQQFREDVTKLDGYAHWAKNPTTYTLSHSYYGTGCFSAKTAVFIPTWMAQEIDDNLPQEVIINYGSQKGQEKRYLFPSIESLQAWALEKSELNDGIHKVGPYKGDKLVRRVIYVDQISELVRDLKKNPDSRRHIVVAWNPAYSEQMALTPCHCLFQFYVHNAETPGGKRGLSCQLYQRSADIFLGVPFNIASYSLLTMMIAQVCGYEAREFVHSFGDLHLYSNHLEQADTQLARTPKKLPTMKINPEVTELLDFKFEDFELCDYNADPSIKAPVAV